MRRLLLSSRFMALPISTLLLPPAAGALEAEADASPPGSCIQAGTLPAMSIEQWREVREAAAAARLTQ